MFRIGNRLVKMPNTALVSGAASSNAVSHRLLEKTSID
jgi:hypothetical protein